MKTVILTLYSFDDLSKNIQKQIINRERWNIMEQCMLDYSSDYRNSLEALEKAFNIKCKAWQVGYCNYRFSFDITKLEAFEWKHNYIGLDTLSGKLLQRYIRNNIMPIIEKGKYYGKLIGTYPDCRYIGRNSNIIKNIDCPLTGYVYDMSFLDPLLKYISSPDQTTNYEELISKCLKSFFEDWHKEYEYWADDEDAIFEELHHNQYEHQLYYKDGTKYLRPIEDVS